MRLVLSIALLLVALALPAFAYADAIDNPAVASEWWLQGAQSWSDEIGRSFESQGVDATAVWPRSEGQGVVIADIDSGVDASHPDLQGALLPEVDFAGTHGDKVGHGTHVTGILAARGENGLLAGVAPRALVLPLNVNPSDSTQIDFSALLAAVRYAALRPDVKIINMSLGGVDDPRLAAAIHMALRHGKVVVAAAGNTGTDNESEWPFFPCNYYGVLCVAATDQRNDLTWWSNYSFDKVILAAPGDEINSTFLNDGYAIEKGTSMATPMVSGVAALLWAADPQATANQIIRAIVLGVTPNPNLVGYVRTGGTVSAPGALAVLDRLLAENG